MQHVTEKVEKIFEHLGVPYSSLEVIKDDEIDTTIISIFTDHGQYWIDKDGESLRALNYLLRNMTASEAGLNFLVDVNQFQQKHLAEIKVKAKIIADRVKSFGADIEMDPMSSYDRMIVHSYLARRGDVSTESIGFGSERRLVVKNVY